METEITDNLVASLDGFHVGEKVMVVKGGLGIAGTQKGTIVTIVELGIKQYSGENAARIKEKLGNEASGACGRWINLISFKKLKQTTTLYPIFN